MIQEANFKSFISDVSWDRANPFLDQLDAELPLYGIDTPLRQAHFLAQITHESGGYKFVVENLNYSAKALFAVFRKYFPNLDTANQFARKPEQIANKVYANRMGNGDEASGDGWKYRGRGLIQLTGKENYDNFGKAAGIDAVGNPDLVSQPKWALASACWFWKKNNLNRFADDDDIVMVTKRINGGTHGLANREHFLDEYKGLLGVPTTTPEAQ